ncbi:hypothetical protein AWRI1631_153450 [Saccharomyces cerevisiae AWRI1631]|uniref:Uncharacterized protein n=1 Tax=Saccharomyces cerevisiae (strain AWRI1631) TaxID=545124 RepID=B5VS77_YEAS6|nr:hypothetical protein AWRI1631_153450 [Saccharomyces cerevisiae AWRI1631]
MIQVLQWKITWYTLLATLKLQLSYIKNGKKKEKKKEKK